MYGNVYYLQVGDKVVGIDASTKSSKYDDLKDAKIGLQDKAADDLNQLWRMQSNSDGLFLFNVGQGYVLDFALNSGIQTVGDKKPGLWDAEGTNAKQRLYLTADDKLYAVYNNTPYYLCSSTSNYKTTDASAALAVSFVQSAAYDESRSRRHGWRTRPYWPTTSWRRMPRSCRMPPPMRCVPTRSMTSRGSHLAASS